MAIQWSPEKKGKSISIQIYWPQANPSVIDQEINLPVEGLLQLIDGVKNIQTLTQTGQSTFIIEFDETIDIDLTRYELSARIRQLYQQFPSSVSAPVVRVNTAQNNGAKTPILVYSLSGNTDNDLLTKYARNHLIPALSGIAGIQELVLNGNQQKEWQIILDSDKMALAKLNISDIQLALQQYMESASIGVLETHKHRIHVSLQGNTLQRAQDIGAIPILKNKDRILLLQDIAQIQSATQSAQAIYRLNGQSAIRLLIFAKPGSNILQTASRFKAEIQQLSQTFAPNCSIQLDHDASDYIRTELDKILRRSLYALSMLSILLLLSYRRWQGVFYMLICLIVNMGISCLFYWLLEIPLHLYALAGITVSFGLIIDNVLVMLQHWKRYQNHSVFPALLASTLTTLAALISIFFLPEHWKISLEAFAQVIIINLIISLLTSTIFLPALMQLPISVNKKNSTLAYSQLKRQVLLWQHYSRLITFLQANRRLITWMLILLFGLPVFLLPPKLGQVNWYNKSLGSTFFIENVKPILGGSLGLFLKKINRQSNFFKSLEETKITVNAQLTPGHKLEHLDSIFKQLEGVLTHYPEQIRSYSTHLQNDQLGYMHIHFQEASPSIFPHQLKAQLEKFCRNMGNVEWNIRGVGRGFSQGGNFNSTSYRLQMRGYHRQKLKEQARQLADSLLANPRIKSVNLNANTNWKEEELFQYNMLLDKQKLVLHEYSPSLVKLLLNEFNQTPSASLRTNDGQLIQLISQPQLEREYWHLNHQQIRRDSHYLILGQLGKIEKEQVKSQIIKENQEYIQYLDFDFIGPYTIGNSFLKQCLDKARLQMPTGFSVKRQGGTNREMNKQWIVLPLIYLLIFLICASTLESFQQAKKIILLIWLSYIGIFLGFGSLNLPVDQGIYTAFILVSGLVVNALILLFNEYKHLSYKFPKYTYYYKLYIKGTTQKNQSDNSKYFDYYFWFTSIYLRRKKYRFLV